MIAEVDLDGKKVEDVVADWMAANEARWSSLDREVDRRHVAAVRGAAASPRCRRASVDRIA